MAQQTASVSVGGTPENPILNFILPTGAKGEPGGWNAGTDIGTSDLNDIIQPGLYKATTAANVTTERHYPIAGAQGTGILEVLWQGNTTSQAKIQRYTIVWGNSSARVMFIRHYTSGAWGPWNALTSQRVDTTAGRAIYTWDDAAGREQLIYGDTGNLNIAAFLNPNFQATEAVDRVNIRRVGSVVTLILRVRPAPGLVGLSRSDNRLALDQIPQGFREGPTSYGNSYVGTAAAPLAMLAFGATNTNGDLRVRGASGETWRANEVISLVATWLTNEPWPTTLPGIPA